MKTTITTATILVLIALTIATPTIIMTQNTQKQNICGQCPEDIAQATYLALNQLDCDQADNGANCTDELNNINVAPRILTLHTTTTHTTLTLQFTLTGGQDTITYTFQYNTAGDLQSMH